MRIIPFLLLVLSSQIGLAQNITQNIKGRVLDIISDETLPFANIIILDSDPLIGTTSDIEGNFILKNIPIGRYDLEVSYLGFESIIIPEVIVTSSKEVILNIKMKENTNLLTEVIVAPKSTKEKPLNQMALVSSRMLSIEEANRYAGGFDDPARLAASFAGVTSSISNNAIIVRGNAPKYLQWKIDGVEIPNPNHFADLNVVGGGGLTALSSKLLDDSDFFTGAFPAEYNNAISGIFDIKLRNGNNQKYEHSFEVGAIGIDLATEGPLSKNKKSSYLINYRYSTLGLISPLLHEDAQGTNYQDLSFKFKFPSKRIGILSLWGLGLIDNSGTNPEQDANFRFYYQDIEQQKAKQFMGVSGINHKLILSNSAYLNSTVAYTSNRLNLYTQRLNQDNQLAPQIAINNINNTINFVSYINKKFSANHNNRSGININILDYNFDLHEANELNNNLIEIADEDGASGLISAYSSSSLNLKDITVSLGINYQLFLLNQNYTIEPRLGISHHLNDNHKFSIGYGQHSRIEALSLYLSNTTYSNHYQANRDLDFTKAHHFVFAYDWCITDKLHFKFEPYYQRLTDVPVIENTNISLINLKNELFINDTYVNKGKGQNYGLDITLEQYIHNGFYYLISGSIFQSKYTTNDRTWFNTRFNKTYLANLLVGKEFRLGQSQNLLSINFKVNTQGGERFSPIDRISSSTLQDVVFDESKPFSESSNPVMFIHFTIQYEWYKTSTTHKISLKILNATNQKEFQGYRFNIQTNEIDEFREALLIPNLSYKISF